MDYLSAIQLTIDRTLFNTKRVKCAKALFRSENSVLPLAAQVDLARSNMYQKRVIVVCRSHRLYFFAARKVEKPRWHS